MNPIYFGSSSRSLFGVYHPPKAAQAKSAGVVLCYPFGQEYMRAHRAFRQLSLLLTKAGFHVMRFDYFGTGDSSGEVEEISFGQWVEDANAAAEELKDTAEVRRIAFVGLRLGAAVAAAAASTRDDVDQVVLWDPPVRGADYLAEIFKGRQGAPGDPAPPGHSAGVMGFPMPPAMRADLSSLDLLTVATPPGGGRLVIASHERAEYRELAESGAGAARTKHLLVPSEGSWNEVDDYGGALIPVFLIQAIVSYLAAEIR